MTPGGMLLPDGTWIDDEDLYAVKEPISPELKARADKEWSEL